MTEVATQVLVTKHLIKLTIGDNLTCSFIKFVIIFEDKVNYKLCQEVITERFKDSHMILYDFVCSFGTFKTICNLMSKSQENNQI